MTMYVKVDAGELDDLRTIRIVWWGGWFVSFILALGVALVFYQSLTIERLCRDVSSAKQQLDRDQTDQLLLRIPQVQPSPDIERVSFR